MTSERNQKSNRHGSFHQKGKKDVKDPAGETFDMDKNKEEVQLHSTATQTSTILVARKRAEYELSEAKKNVGEKNGGT
jgi:hypothetical protein